MSRGWSQAAEKGERQWAEADAQEFLSEDEEFFTVRVTKNQNKLPRKVVGFPEDIKKPSGHNPEYDVWGDPTRAGKLD